MDKMDNRDCDNIDEDDWYAGLGVVPISSEKTSSSAPIQGSTMATESNIAHETDLKNIELVNEDSTKHVVVSGRNYHNMEDISMSDMSLGRELGHLHQNQRENNTNTVINQEGFDLIPRSGVAGSRAGHEGEDFHDEIQENEKGVASTTILEEEEEEEEDLGVILAEEVNSRSYTNIPYGKGVSMVSKASKSVSFVRRDRVVFLGSPPELPERVNPDPGTAGAMTRVGSIIVISNLMWWINDIHVRELATEFGAIRAVRIIERPKDGRSLGICLIEYVNSDSAPKALQGISASFANKFEGRPLYVVPLPLHGELHIALDNITPHWSRGGVITEEILAMICQLVGVDVQTAGLEIQPETGTIVGFVQPRFADYASYYFPDGTPSWFPPLYVEALKHLKDLIPPSRLQNRQTTTASSTKHSSSKTRSNYNNNTNNNGITASNYINVESDSDPLNHLDEDFGGANEEMKDLASSHNGTNHTNFTLGDHPNKGLKKGHESNLGSNLSGNYSNINNNQIMEENYQSSTSGRGSKSVKYEHGLSEHHSVGHGGGGNNNGEVVTSFRDDDEHFSAGGGPGPGSGGGQSSRRFANQRRDYRERGGDRAERGERGDRDRDRDRDRERERDRGDRGDRGERSERGGERGERSERGGERGERSERSERGDRDRERERDRGERSERGERDRNRDRNREKSDRDRIDKGDIKAERPEKERHREKDWERDRGGDQEKGSTNKGSGGSSMAASSMKEASERGGGTHNKKSSGGGCTTTGGNSLDHGKSSKSSLKKHRSSSESSRSRSPQRKSSSKHVRKDLGKFSANSSKEKSWEGRSSGGGGSSSNNGSRGSKNSYRESRSLAERGGWERRSNRR